MRIAWSDLRQNETEWNFLWNLVWTCCEAVAKRVGRIRDLTRIKFARPIPCIWSVEVASVVSVVFHCFRLWWKISSCVQAMAWTSYTMGQARDNYIQKKWHMEGLDGETVLELRQYSWRDALPIAVMSSHKAQNSGGGCNVAKARWCPGHQSDPKILSFA